MRSTVYCLRILKSNSNHDWKASREIDVYFRTEEGGWELLGSLEAGAEVRETLHCHDRLLVRTEEADGGCVYAWDLQIWKEMREEYGSGQAASLSKTCLLPGGEGWHVPGLVAEHSRMAWCVWDMMEQEDIYDRDVEVADFNTNTEHGFVLTLDFTASSHPHGEEYAFIQELSKAHSFQEFRPSDCEARPTATL